MASLLVCVAQRPAFPRPAEAAPLWQHLGLPVLLLGEWPEPHHPGVTVLAEIAGTRADEPRLDALLRRRVRADPAAERLLLLASDALPDQAWSEAVQELATQFPTALLCGRAWHHRGGALPRIDPPAQPAWLLLPPDPDLPPAELGPELAAEPGGCFAWCLEQARQRGIPVIDATDVAPLRRAGAAPAAPAGGAEGWPLTPARAQRLSALPPGSPALSLLLLDAPELEESWRQELAPFTAVPWELVGACAADAPALWLPRCRGAWIWPLRASATQAPDLALLAAILAAARSPHIDAIAVPGEPAALPVLRRGWLEPWPQLPRSAAEAIRLLEDQGAHLHTLPLQASDAAPSEPLPPAVQALLLRAELLLLRAESRLREQAEQLARLQADRPQPG